MPIYSRAEFQRVYNLTPQAVSNAKTKGKLQFDGKVIDTEHPINKEWYLGWKNRNSEHPMAKLGEAAEVRDAIKTIKKSKTQKKTTVKRQKEFDFDSDEITEEDIETANNIELNKYKKTLEILKLRKDYEHRKIQVEKQMGLVIPTELVMGTFKRHFKSVGDAFADALDNTLVEINHRLGGSKEDLAEFRISIKGFLNSAIKDSKKSSIKEIQSIVDEYSETRGKGESK